MPMSKRFTLTRYLIEQRRRFPDAGGDFNATKDVNSNLVSTGTSTR